MNGGGGGGGWSTGSVGLSLRRLHKGISTTNRLKIHLVTFSNRLHYISYGGFGGGNLRFEAVSLDVEDGLVNVLHAHGSLGSQIDVDKGIKGVLHPVGLLFGEAAEHTDNDSA
jgi:hypothetical protein